jgi:hypothetical protein
MERFVFEARYLFDQRFCFGLLFGVGGFCAGTMEVVDDTGLLDSSVSGGVGVLVDHWK